MQLKFCYSVSHEALTIATFLQGHCSPSLKAKGLDVFMESVIPYDLDFYLIICFSLLNSLKIFCKMNRRCIKVDLKTKWF